MGAPVCVCEGEIIRVSVCVREREIVCMVVAVLQSYFNR
jgi:hypothetical protein